MNSPIQWFLLLLCDRRTAPTLFSTLAWYPPVGGTRRIGKDSPVHRPDGLRPSRRRITACDQRFEGYPSMLACYIRRAAGTHEYLYYDSSGQRRAGPQLTGLGTSCAPVLFLSSQRNIPMRRKTHTQLFSQRNIPGNASQKGGYRPKCVSVLACVPLWQWAFLLFELYGRGTRGRPECVSGMAGQALRHNG